jgi:hypothetical protein
MPIATLVPQVILSTGIIDKFVHVVLFALGLL